MQRDLKQHDLCESCLLILDLLLKGQAKGSPFVQTGQNSFFRLNPSPLASRAETNLLCSLLPVLVEQMSVDFPDKNSAVFVPKPCSDCHKVDSGHDADGAEV